MDPKQELKRFKGTLSFSILSFILLILSQLNYMPLMWQDILWLPLVFIASYSVIFVIDAWSNYKKAKEGKPWWHASENDKKWQFERLRELE